MSKSNPMHFSIPKKKMMRDTKYAKADMPAKTTPSTKSKPTKKA